MRMCLVHSFMSVGSSAFLCLCDFCAWASSVLFVFPSIIKVDSEWKLHIDLSSVYTENVWRCVNNDQQLECVRVRTHVWSGEVRLYEDLYK